MPASDKRSPPARPTVHDRLGMFSSSPSLPDLRDLVAAKPNPKSRTRTIRSGSAAAPLPANASTTFTSASDLLREARATGDDSFDVIDEPELPVPKKAPAKRVRKTTKDPALPKEHKPARISKPKKDKVPRRLAKEVIVLSSDGITPKVTRHEDAAAETGVHESDTDRRLENEGTPLKAKPWKKFKAPTSTEQLGTDGAEVVSAKPPAKAKAQRKKAKPETVSKHFAQENDSVEPEPIDVKEKRPKAAKASTPEPTNLEPAVQRRTDWTPVKPDTIIPQSSPDPFGTPDDLPAANADGTAMDATLFQTLRDTYGHKVADGDAVAAPRQQLGQVLGKRKVIELVSTNTSAKPTEASRETSPAKARARAPKKKARTITELATAAYGPQATEETHTEGSVLEYFSVGGAEQNPSNGTAAAKGQGKAARAKVTKSKKKIPTKKPVLLSPQAAMRQSAAQDFVFGTASQLAREQSPTLLRDLHAAMKESTINEADPSGDPKPKGKGLWAISARDEEGELVDIEIIDLITPPALPLDDAILDARKHLPPEAVGTETETDTADSSVMDLDSRPVATLFDKSSQAPVPKSHFFTTQKLTINTAVVLSPKSPFDFYPYLADLLGDDIPPLSNQQQTQKEVKNSPSKATLLAKKAHPRPNYKSFTDAKLATQKLTINTAVVSPPESAFDFYPYLAELLGDDMPPPSNQQQTQEEVRDSPSKATLPAKKALPRPDYESFTDAKLAKEISKFGFKAVKARTGMIALLDQCWKSKLQEYQASMAGTSSATTSVLASPKRKLKDLGQDATTPSPAKKPRGRSKKAADAGTIDDADDVDLFGEVGASGSLAERFFSPERFSPDASVSDDTAVSLNLSPKELQSETFRYITKAVRSAPRTTDPQEPSWHEKILMYDPIIVDDLTAWLNSGQLTKVGYDDEVSLLEVRKWCEVKSICCIRRNTWRGTERKRL